jgi:hypothetical protein
MWEQKSKATNLEVEWMERILSMNVALTFCSY